MEMDSRAQIICKEFYEVFCELAIKYNDSAGLMLTIVIESCLISLTPESRKPFVEFLKRKIDIIGNDAYEDTQDYLNKVEETEKRG